MKKYAIAAAVSFLSGIATLFIINQYVSPIFTGGASEATPLPVEQPSPITADTVWHEVSVEGVVFSYPDSYKMVGSVPDTMQTRFPDACSLYLQHTEDEQQLIAIGVITESSDSAATRPDCWNTGNFSNASSREVAGMQRDATAITETRWQAEDEIFWQNNFVSEYSVASEEGSQVVFGLFVQEDQKERADILFDALLLSIK